MTVVRSSRAGSDTCWWTPTEGFVLKAKVHSAKVMDYEGIKPLLEQAGEQFSRLKHLCLDAGYRGEDKGKDWVEKTLGWSVDLVVRERKPAPKEVSQGGVDSVGQGVGQRRRAGRLGETVASARLSGAAKAVGSGTDIFLDRQEQEDE